MRACEPEPPPAENMSLFGAPEPAEIAVSQLASSPAEDPACRLGLAVSDTLAIEVSLDSPGVKEALVDAALPKDVHDLKAILRALASHKVCSAWRSG